MFSHQERGHMALHLDESKQGEFVISKRGLTVVPVGMDEAIASLKPRFQHVRALARGRDRAAVA